MTDKERREKLLYYDNNIVEKTRQHYLRGDVISVAEVVADLLKENKVLGNVIVIESNSPTLYPQNHKHWHTTIRTLENPDDR